MSKYDYEALRREIDHWSPTETVPSGSWRWPWRGGRRQSNEAFLSEVIGDTSGLSDLAELKRRTELLDLVRQAEACDAAGDMEKAELLVLQVRRELAEPGHAVARASASEFDPAPRGLPDIALLEDCEHDFDALRKAVARWQEREERELHRIASPALRAGTGEPMVGLDGAGGDAGFQDVRDRVGEFYALIDRAEDCVRRGDADAADRLVFEVQDGLGIADHASAQIEAFIYEAARRGQARQRRMKQISAYAALLGLAALAYGLFG